MMIKSFADTLQGIVALLGLVVILITLGPVLIIALALGVVLMLLFYKLSSGTMVKTMEKIVPINRIYGYYLNVALDKPAQKDIRLYGMDKMITDRIIKFGEDTCDEFDKTYRGIGFAMGGMSAVSELLSAFTYAYVGIRAVSTMFGPKLSIGSLTMYVSSAITFSSTIITFGQNVVGLWQNSQFLIPYNEFMSLKEETVEDGGLKFTGEVETLEFRNVTFTYPKAEKPVLRNISFQIKKGEKISIVGLNGAGKSTLVKLICRMYKTDSGEILVNGRNIYDYDYMS